MAPAVARAADGGVPAEGSARRAESGAEREGAHTGEIVGPVLPETLAPRQSSWWVVGVAAETFGTDVKGTNLLLGVDVIYRTRAFSPHLLLMMKPNSLMRANPTLDNYQDYRALAGLGMRAHVPVFGTELSYGVGAHAEVRLEDHYWTMHFTPVEVGTLLYGEDSWDIELFVGLRHAFAGSLINHFIIDPNGFDNEVAQDELDEQIYGSPWNGFLRVVFGRRID
jgi:hypothetical protein